MTFIKHISLCVAVLVREFINPRWIKSIPHRRSLWSHPTPRGLSFSVTAPRYTLICIQWFIARFGFISLSYICLSNEMKRQSYSSKSRNKQLYTFLAIPPFHYKNTHYMLLSAVTILTLKPGPYLGILRPWAQENLCPPPYLFILSYV
jgi:hypothetical protein